MRERIEKIVELIKSAIAPDRIYLFGSRATGEERPFSDIDICVEIGIKPEHREIRILKERIDDIAGLHSVDLIFMQDGDEDFRNMIKKRGVILYEKE